MIPITKRHLVLMIKKQASLHEEDMAERANIPAAVSSVPESPL